MDCTKARPNSISINVWIIGLAPQVAYDLIRSQCVELDIDPSKYTEIDEWCFSNLRHKRVHPIFDVYSYSTMPEEADWASSLLTNSYDKLVHSFWIKDHLKRMEFALKFCG